MVSVNDDKEITDLFQNIYQYLYNRVPTSDTEVVDLKEVLTKELLLKDFKTFGCLQILQHNLFHNFKKVRLIVIRDSNLII